MLQFILSFIGFSSVNGLQRKSANALKAFHDAKDKLAKVNRLIGEQHDLKVKKIAKLQEKANAVLGEARILKTQQADNEKLHAKITEFLS